MGDKGGKKNKDRQQKQADKKKQAKEPQVACELTKVILAKPGHRRLWIVQQDGRISRWVPRTLA
jgi:hypothetical protein